MVKAIKAVLLGAACAPLIMGAVASVPLLLLYALLLVPTEKIKRYRENVQSLEAKLRQ